MIAPLRALWRRIAGGGGHAPVTELPAVARAVREANLTYLSPEKFVSLANAVATVKRERVAGDFAEYGIALGGSAIYLAGEALPGRRFLGYDLFGMIPSPGERDDAVSKARYEVIRSGQSEGIGGDLYYGYEADLYGKVSRSFEAFGLPVDGRRVVLTKGLFEDTLRFSGTERIALAHLDCDWFEPVKLCLDRTAPVLSVGGMMILDDYNDYGGSRLAATAFLEENPGFALVQAAPNAIVRRLR